MLLAALTLPLTLRGSPWQPAPAGSPPLRFDPATFAAGDLVFRQGRSMLSRAVLAADGRSSYSHVGIVVQMGGQPFVVHAEPGGRGEAAEPVKMESLARFLRPRRARAAVQLRLRPTYAAYAAAAAAAAQGYVRAGSVFDDRFDLATASSLYCTELVWRAYRSAGLDLVQGRFDSLALPLSLGEGPHLLPSTLLDSRFLEPVLVMDGSNRSP